MPWVGIENEFQIGPVKFMPLNKAFKRIKDSSIKEHLTKIFKSYVDHQGKPVEMILLCSYSDMDFHYLTEEEYRDLMNTVNVLVFCTITPAIKKAVCADNRSMGPPSTEIFQLITQNFQLGINHIVFQAGSSSSEYWEIGEVTFPKPWATGGSFGSSDKELVQGFCKVFDAKFSGDVRERIFRSLEWFRMSHVENSEVSILSKIVMMATTFEILLQVPNIPNKKQWIREEIEKRISNSDFLMETRTDPKGKDYTYSKVAWWSWDFYEIRNSIVHGDYVKPECIQYCAPSIKWLTHLIVADLVFWECVKRELFKHRCIGDNVYSCAKEWDQAFPEEPQGTSIEPLARLFLGFDDVHKALGWIKEDEI